MNEQALQGKIILTVDDEADLREIVASELEYMGATVFQAENIKAAQDFLNQNKVDLIVSDIRMPGGTGIDLLKFIKNRNVNVPPIILITGFADITVEDALHEGAEALINKPFRLDELIHLTTLLTSPVESRLSKAQKGKKEIKISFSGEIQESKSERSFSMGRGGISLQLDDLGHKFELGDIVHFDIRFGDGHLNGTAICRWFRPLNVTSQKSAIGLEFVHLDNPSLDYLLNYLNKNLVVPFVPSFGR